MSDLKKAKQWINEADALLLGASNGLSIAEGYHIFANNEMFQKQFNDLQQKFGINSIIDGCFYQYPSESYRKDFFSRLIKYWIDDYKPSEVMKNLLNLVKSKDYFILTSNGDTHLEISGFDQNRIFEIEGTFRDELSPNQSLLNEKSKKYQEFVNKYKKQKLVIIELGIGMRNRLIKAPLMNLTYSEPTVRYITLNLQQELYIPKEIEGRSIGLPGDIAETLERLSN